MSTMLRMFKCASLMFALSLFTIVAVGQVSTASLFGTVTDRSGAVIPKAKVVILQTDTGFTRTVVTNSAGEYRADFLPVGPYKVSADAKGFKHLDREGITLTVTKVAKLDMKMSIGSQDQSIEVTAEMPLLNTGNSTLGRTVTNEEIDNLPLVDRNVYQLLDLTPGVQNNNNAGMGANGGVINPLGYPEQHVKINGSSDSAAGQVAYYLDGGSNMTGLRNTGNPLPNPDAVLEFRVDTSNFSAQYGRNSAGVVSVLTKSGTNQFHGSVFEFYRTRNFNATLHNTTSKVPYNQQRFGFTVGGPVIHDKLFFFGSYAGFRFKSANVLTSNVPSAAMQTGNFAENMPTTGLTGAAACASSVKATSTSFYACDPFTHTAYAGNIVPLAKQDPAIAAIFKAGLIPTPNPSQPGDSIYTRRDFAPYTQLTNEQLYKTDYVMSPRQHLTFSYFHMTGDYQQNPSGNNILNWVIQDYTFAQHDANIGYTYTLTNNTINQLALNYTRLMGGRISMPMQSLGSFGSAFTQQLFNGQLCGTTAQSGCTRPQFGVSGWFAANDAVSGPITGSNVYALRDVVSSTHGNHTLYFGGEANRENDAQETSLDNYGVFSFTQATAGTADRSSAAITDFLFGTPVTMEQDTPVYANANYYNWGAFFQDDWRARPNLTLNLGIRYDVQTAPTDTQNMDLQFVPGRESTVAPTLPLGLLLPGDKGVPRSAVDTRFDHVSPRIGMAWTPFGDGRTVVHAAAGMFYGSISSSLWASSGPFFERPKFTHVTSVANPYATDPTDFCNADPTCIAGGVGSNPYPFIYNPKNPSFVVLPAAIISMAPNFHWPEIYQINFGIQQQFTRSMAVSASYVASLGRKLPTEWDVNYPTFNLNAAGASGAACTNTTLPCGYANTTSTTNNRRPYNSATYAATSKTTAANPEFLNISQIQSSESTEYNALQVTVQQRMLWGFNMQGYYVWSKNLQSLDLDEAGNYGNTPADEPEDNNNHFLDRQRSDYDQRHTVAISAVWKPNYGFHNRAIRYFVNNWTVTSIIQLQSGVPFNITTGADDNSDGVTNDRPNLAPGVSRAMVKNNGNSRSAMEKEWVDMHQFCRPFNSITDSSSTDVVAACPQNGAGPAGSDGTLREDALDAPGRRGIAASIFRNVPITSHVTFQMRAEATNVFNLTNLPAPTATLSSGYASFGHITGTITGGPFSNRILQIGGRILF